MTVNAPTSADLQRHAKALHLSLSDEELETYRMLMRPSIELLDALDAAEDTVLQPRYPRPKPSHPDPEGNQLNAWAVRCTVQGAQTGPLAGRTVVLKDTISLAGTPLLNGTDVLDNGYLSASDATVVTRVLDAGATIVGKANCEYLSASGGSHTSASGPVRNPHRPDYASGGSSSGCAVLVSTGEVDMAVGGDQGGSIRVPASHSGIVGLKPTHGLVPYTGAVGVEPTMDHLGPMTRTVHDNALLLSVLAGEDGLDPRQYSPQKRDYLGEIEDGIDGLRVGILTDGFGLAISEADVDRAVRDAADLLGRLGATVEPVSVPEHATADTVWIPITAEGAVRTMCYADGLGSLTRGFYPIDLVDHLATLRSSADAMPPNAKLFLLLGEHMSDRHHGRYFAKAQNRLLRVRAAYDAALARYDVLVLPTTPMKARPLPATDAPLADLIRHAFEPLTNTGIFDATGHPALNLPVAMSDGLPVGMMIVGRHYDEPTLYRVAHALEQSLALDLSSADSCITRPPREHLCDPLRT